MPFKEREKPYRLSARWLERIHAARPLIECLTNVVTVQEVANVLLCVGASPVMAEAMEDIRDVVVRSSAVVVNIGTVTASSATVDEQAMTLAAEWKKPIVFDPVGAGATAYRTDLSRRLLKAAPCTVIRGNASEIRSLLGGVGRTVGVDVAADDVVTDSTLPESVRIVQAVAREYACIVSMSGEIDIVGDGQSCLLCRNGVPWLNRVTGTGCSLTGMTAAMMAVADASERLEGAAAAVAMMGLAGERAFEASSQKGLGTFACEVMNELSKMTDETLAEQMKLSRWIP